jgi:hypothetical protein
LGRAHLRRRGARSAAVSVDWLHADPAPARLGGVTRFGRYVLGTEGWRAEWVIIRELLAPDAEIALALMRRYPDVRLRIREQEATDEDR